MRYGWLVGMWLLLFPISVSATSLVISNVPSETNVDEPFSITASFSGSKSGCGGKSYYLMGILFKEAGNELFGLTEASSGAWIDHAASPSQSFQFTADENGSWSGILRIKGDHTDSAFDLSQANGQYYLRIDRFTLTGTSKTESSNSVPIVLMHAVSPTPTPSASSGPTATPSASSGPTATPSASSGPTATPTTTPQLSPSLKPTTVPSVELGNTIISTPSSTLAGTVSGIIDPPKKSVTMTPLLFLVGGLLLAGGAIPLGLTLFKEE